MSLNRETLLSAAQYPTDMDQFTKPPSAYGVFFSALCPALTFARKPQKVAECSQDPSTALPCLTCLSASASRRTLAQSWGPHWRELATLSSLTNTTWPLVIYVMILSSPMPFQCPLVLIITDYTELWYWTQYKILTDAWQLRGKSV